MSKAQPLTRAQATSLLRALAGAPDVYRDIVMVASDRYSPEALDLGYSYDQCVSMARAALASGNAYETIRSM